MDRMTHSCLKLLDSTANYAKRAMHVRRLGNARKVQFALLVADVSIVIRKRIGIWPDDFVDPVVREGEDGDDVAEGKKMKMRLKCLMETI